MAGAGYVVETYAPNGELLDGRERYTRKAEAFRDARRWAALGRYGSVAIWSAEFTWKGNEATNWGEPRTDLDPLWFWRIPETMGWESRLNARSQDDLDREIETMKHLGYRVSVLGVKEARFDLGWAEVYLDTPAEG